MHPLPPRKFSLTQGGPKIARKIDTNTNAKKITKNTTFGPQSLQLLPSGRHFGCQRMSSGAKNRCFSGFGGKRCFSNLSHTESLFSGLQGTQKVKKFRVEIGYPNNPLSKRCFFWFWGARGAKKSAKAPQRVPQGTPDGTPKR